ncbi:ead/Ea22-like family protein [Escherichia coli]|nr:ead/Ea22-like family protein [Escherichia coli]EIG4854986.1 ead/Ea22-like family protein [Escherichia coli]EIG4859597.1 ead/Ea22-like family protein [Escherichia coli]EIG4870360.1 ead/Ea22-like family protein [Escherichia coli]EKF0334607.1 ead/Ea22-like family protein [Escherichia coli]
MSKIDYQALREKAEKATKGSYIVGHTSVNQHGNLTGVFVCQKWKGEPGGVIAECHVNCLVETDVQAYANAEFIAEVNPATVLAVLDEREAQSKRIAELETNLAALAAENAGLNKFIAQSCYVFDGEQDELSDAYICAIDGRMPQTPATDAFLAEVRAEARNEGINYTASRLAAAFNHGFINKSLREVFDVTRMILSAKEKLANEPHPIVGLSGEYAEKSLEEWAEQIRKGSSQ